MFEKKNPSPFCSDSWWRSIY
uniref:Uncharacterized protein n=1 Tax=Arundo donax TaxID=35708 RepID=A0A0A8ZKD3_ARUDO